MRLGSFFLAPAGQRVRAAGALVAMTVLAAAGALATAACGTSPTTSATPIGTATPPGPAGAPSGTVGADCTMIPAHGAGSLRSMSTQRAVAAAASNPQLSVFTAAVRTSGLDKTLAARHAFTLMIPVNSAFAGLSKTQIIHLHNSGDLLKTVRYHAVAARIGPARFDRGASYPTMEGGSLRVARSGPDYTVNGATVLCGNIKTANATVYIISKVLQPPK